MNYFGMQFHDQALLSLSEVVRELTVLQHSLGIVDAVMDFYRRKKNLQALKVYEMRYIEVIKEATSEYQLLKVMLVMKVGTPARD